MQEAYPTVDLHSDLLSFLVDHPSKKVEDPASRASYPQMKQGNIALQALTFFTPSKPGAHLYAKRQIEALKILLDNEPDKYRLWDPNAGLDTIKAIQVVPAFENAYALCEEAEPLQKGLSFLSDVHKTFKHILYISLTWDLENRFGGGCGSKAGLKEDGKSLLQWMDGKKIAVDLSHASDYLASDILDFLSQKSLQVPVIASHSNMRSIHPKERNLPDWLVLEILNRQGIIGLNFFAPFIGSNFEQIQDHVEHLFSLGGKNHLCFGGDFFLFEDFDYLMNKYQTNVPFFSEFSNASCYPLALQFLQKALSLTSSDLQAIAFDNFLNYAKKTFIV
jgi:microsomal dipeptidase-like Zn-dependent dipeptidase